MLPTDLERRLWDAANKLSTDAAPKPAEFSPFVVGLSRTNNGNHLWSQHFHAALNATDRAGFMMSTSAAAAPPSRRSGKSSSAAAT